MNAAPDPASTGRGTPLFFSWQLAVAFVSTLHAPNGDVAPDVSIFLYFCLITSISMKTIALNNVVWREDEHFVAQCLNVDVSSFGATKEEALTNLQEALELYFEDNDHPEVNYIHDAELIDSTLNYA